MRNKRSETGRENGGKGNGPTSAEGKNRVRMNALKSGFYGKDVVIGALGESWEDFEKCREALRTSFMPEDFVEEALCDDAAENWWRRERVRRFESAAIRGAIFDAQYRAELERPQVVTELKSKFIRLFRERQGVRLSVANAPGGKRSFDEIDEEIAAVRQQLHKSLGGLDYLIGAINSLKWEAQTTGQLTDTSELFLRACVGEGERFATGAITANRLIRKDTNTQAKKNERATTTDSSDSQKANVPGKSDADDYAESNRQLIGIAVDAMISGLKTERLLLEQLERTSDELVIEEAAVLASDKTSHAETRYDRRFYKALTTLYTIRFQEARKGLVGESLRQLPEKSGRPED